MNVESVAVDQLIAADYNPRTMSTEMMDRLVKGIQQFGLVQPIVVNRATGHIVGGHQRWAAAKQAGLAEVPVFYVDLDETREKALNLALNKITGDWDADLLKRVLEDIADDIDVDLTGFGEDELSMLLAELEADEFEPKCDEDEVPDVEEETVSRPGDVYTLGRHRLICGDSTQPDSYDRLLEGDRADMVFTDPPYLMNFEGSMRGDGSKGFNSKHGCITNDKLSREEGDQFLYDICTMIHTYCVGAWYVCFYRLGVDRILNAMERAGMQWRNLIIWKKNQRTLSNSDYKSLYEPIVYGFSDDWSPVVYGWNDEHAFYAGKTEVDVWEVALPSLWEIDRTRKNDLHPTMKPIALCERAIVNSSKAGQVVLDPFGGSGSTLIASEKSGRCARLIELEPKYADVIIRRWQNYTGKQAVRADGIAFDEVERAAAA